MSPGFVPTLLLLLLLGLWSFGVASRVQASSPEDYCVTLNATESKIICICNAVYCSDFEFKWPQRPGSISLVSSSRSGRRFRVVQLPSAGQLGSHNRADASPREGSVSVVRVNMTDRLQKILGWGGAFTDSSGLAISSVPPKVGELILNSYFGQSGLEYNFGRVPISGADFSSRPYSYDDLDGSPNSTDYQLSHWSLQDEDRKYKIPIIKRAGALVEARNETLSLFGSSWSPPIWMKDNHEVTPGRLIDNARVYSSYANYLVKFYEAYRQEGIQFWGSTIQNEPGTATRPSYSFNALEMNQTETAKLVGDHLGPALEAHGYTRDKFKLMVGDDNLEYIRDLVPPVMADQRASKYISGLAFHWYSSGRGNVSYDILTEVYEKIKHQVEFVLMTEACNGDGQDLPHVDLGSWERAERYAADIIKDLHRQTAGWIDWNLCLDTLGGPNWADNPVDAPIIVNKYTGDFYKQPTYYALGHFSKFLKANSVRLTTEQLMEDQPGSWLPADDGKLMSVAVHKEDTDHLVVVVFNRHDQYRQVKLHFNQEVVVFQVESRSINTVVVKLS